MQVKDIYASGSGGSAKNPQLVAQSRQEKNAQMAARAGVTRSEAEPDASQGKKTSSMPLRTEPEEREALALGLDTGYNVTRSFYTLQDAQRDVQDTLNKLKELRRSAPQEPAESAATETDAEPPKAMIHGRPS